MIDGHVPMPGEVSRAPHSVRFLDELPELRRHILEVLPQPLEDDVRTISSPLHPRQCHIGSTDDLREIIDKSLAKYTKALETYLSARSLVVCNRVKRR